MSVYNVRLLRYAHAEIKHLLIDIQHFASL